MVDLVEGLRKIKVNGIRVISIKKVFQDDVYMFEKLGKATSAFTEAMLGFTEDFV